MDLIVQAESGVMDVIGNPEDPPTKTGIAPGDFLGGSTSQPASWRRSISVSALARASSSRRACRTRSIPP
nr:CoA transferase [Halalkalicoccus subterraneus]